jgi:flagellar biosynthesis protein FlhB
MSYTNAVIVLFVVTFALGCIIYPTYRINVRTVLQEYRLFKPEGMFEMKEHLLALSLALLPVYWLFWRRASEANRVARTVLTSLIAVAVWWSFLTGHIINNIRGFGS